MKMVIVPPYRPVGSNFSQIKENHGPVREMVDWMSRRGQLNGVTIDIGSGYPIENPSEERDEVFLAQITPGFIQKIREYSESGEYDAIITNGSIEPGFFAAREVSKVPIASGPHAAIHLASIIGEKFTVLELTDTMAQIVRHYAMSWGMSHKLSSVRTVGCSSLHLVRLLNKYPVMEERFKAPEIKEVVEAAIGQLIAAIKEDGADSIVLGCIPIQTFHDVFRERLDSAGYEEIPLICGVSAATEMARAMVNLRLMPSVRAFPSDKLKAKPKTR